MLSAADIMSIQIRTVSADASLDEAADVLLTHGISGVPVIASTGELVGILTDADLLRRVELGTDEKAGWLSGFVRPGHAADEYARSHGRAVSEVMTRGVFTVGEDAPLSEIVTLMQSRGVKRLPVMSEGDIVGIVSRLDVLKALRKLLSKASDREMSDEQIQNSFFRELGNQSWAPRVGVTANVDHGVIELDGVVSDEREKRALKALAENTPGCCGVQDHLVCVEPLTGAVIDNPSVP